VFRVIVLWHQNLVLRAIGYGKA